MSTKPKQGDAPEWANYRVVDENGRTFYFEEWPDNCEYIGTWYPCPRNGSAGNKIGFDYILVKGTMEKLEK